MIDSLKHVHDSCMGISFDANAILAGEGDHLFIGDILKKQSMEVVGTLYDLGLDPRELANKYNIVTTPCYQKKVINIPLKTLFGENFVLKLAGPNEVINKEINDYIKNSENQRIHAGSWVYLDLNSVLENMADTIKSETGLKYSPIFDITPNTVSSLP